MRCFRTITCIICLQAGCVFAAAGEPVPALSAARKIWEQGQQAMRLGRPDKAIACFMQSLTLDPHFVQANLSLAAAHLEIGDEAGACPHLRRYVDAHPEQPAIRSHYAELLYRLRRTAEARTEFDRFITDVQDVESETSQTLIHCHSRLMEIAEKEDDYYAEHLNRGIGLLLLARARAELTDPAKDQAREGLLCKAAGELTLARQERPEEARPCWYLYEVWSLLGQRQPATHWLHEARAAAIFTHLTPSEHRRLNLACAAQFSERGLK